MSKSQIKALVFDVFGTVVDWRTSISRQARELGEKHGVEADWNKFADDWRTGYGVGMAKVNSGEDDWKTIDQIHRERLDVILDEYGFSTIDMDEEEKVKFNKAWHRLDGWPDSTDGLLRLKSKYIIASLSNGNIALLTNMAKYANLPWDMVLSAELVRKYKPDPETYLSASRLLDIPMNQVMMVAAHKKDLFNAKSLGMKTAYVPRPLENGPDTQIDTASEDYIDLIAIDFLDLHNKLTI